LRRAPQGDDGVSRNCFEDMTKKKNKKRSDEIVGR